MTDDVALTRAYLKHPDKPASWEDFSADKLQTKRPVAPSSIQNYRARCAEHNHYLKNATTRWASKWGSVARCTYHECDCVEHRPVKARTTTSGGNWIMERGS